MADDFRLGLEGRAKTADFLGQLFRRDPTRARSLRARAGAFMAADERRRLDRLILAARLAEEDEEEPEPEEPDPEEPEPEKPKPEKPKPEEPEPEEPKPDKEKCKQLEIDIANTEATVSDWEAQIQDAEQEISDAKREIEALEAENERLELLGMASGLLGRFVPGLFKLGPLAASGGVKSTIKVNNDRISELKDKIRKKQALVDSIKQDLEALKAELADLKAKLEECKGSSG